MESDDHTLFQDFIGTKITPEKFKYLYNKAKGDLNRAIEYYFTESGYSPQAPALADVNSVLMDSVAKKRQPLRQSDPNVWPRVLSLFYTIAKPSRTTCELIAGTKLILKPQLPPKGAKQGNRGRGPNKENAVDTEIRLAFREGELTFARLDHKISKFLHPLLSDGLILLKCVIAEHRQEVRFMDTFQVCMRVSLTAQVENLDDRLIDKNAGKSSLHHDAFIELFKHLAIEKIQESVLGRDQFENNTNNRVRSTDYTSNDVVKLLNAEAGENLEEMDVREGFSRELYTHQKQALKWMTTREEDTVENRELHPLYEEYKMHDGSQIYFNPFTGQI